MDFETREDLDGVRLSWNSVPKSKLQYQRNILPLASVYTPLNNKSPNLVESHDMVRCRQCLSFINPYVKLENDVWHCQFCGFSNRITGEYPVSLNPEASTIEYVTGKVSKYPPVYFYIVDSCFEADDLDAFQSLKDSIIESFSLLPENALVGLITFGKHVQVHELTNLKYHVFNGEKEYNLEQLQRHLGLLSRGMNQSLSIFLQPLNIVEYQLGLILDSLPANNFPHNSMKERPLRSIGGAINVASLLLSSVFGTTVGGHILCFVGGPCTFGPGKIVGPLLKDSLRSHHDIEKSSKFLQSAKLEMVNNAKKLYSTIVNRIVKLGLSVDLFIGSYDQVGLFEMDELCYKTGGVVIMSDSFNTSIFKQSFLKFFQMDQGYNGTLEIKTSRELAIQGLIGHATALPTNKTNNANVSNISPVVVGEGNTNCWKLCSLNSQSSYAIYFDKLDSNLGYAFIQYIFHYQTVSGELRLRVTTIPITILNDSDPNIETGFDQECALVILARDAINKLQNINHTNRTSDSKSSIDSSIVLKQLDKLLIDFCTRFAVYNKADVTSFRLSSTYGMLPQFMYHLRRSPFIQVFNNSPDETSFVRHVFVHEDTTNSLIMVQPTLLSYDIDTFGSVNEATGEVNNEPEPVLLDSMSLGHSKILLLDTFFHILIHHGSKVAQWRKANYHNLEGYEYFRDFLEAPKKEAMELLIDRFPLPRFIDCDEGGSQARFLMAKLNPSTSYATNPNHMYGSSLSSQLDVLTDDASLQLFMDHVKRIIVSKP